MTDDAEQISCCTATARQMILDLNKAFAVFTEAGLTVDLHTETVHTTAHGYGGTKTLRLHLRVWKEIE